MVMLKSETFACDDMNSSTPYDKQNNADLSGKSLRRLVINGNLEPVRLLNEHVGVNSVPERPRSKHMTSPGVLVSPLNQHITCPLCGGYYIDATTTVECLHTFCRSCIVSFLEVTEYCPVCDVKLHDHKPLLGIRTDKILQTLVYKMVPGLYTRELERRNNFYSRNPRHYKMDSSADIGCAELILDDEKISVSLEFREIPVANKRKKKTTQPVNRRYLLCPSKLTIRLIKKFIRAKFDIDSKYQVELYHTDEPLEDHYTLMDLAYIFSWQKTAPFKLFFSAFEVVHKEQSEDKDSDPQTTDMSAKASTSRDQSESLLQNPSFGSCDESEDEADSNDKTYSPFTRQNDDDIYKVKRSRGRPCKRRGLSRLMASQRGWDYHILRSQQKRKPPTGRPRGRPRKNFGPLNIGCRDTFTYLSSSRFTKKRGRPKKYFYQHNFSTPIKQEKKFEKKEGKIKNKYCPQKHPDSRDKCSSLKQPDTTTQQVDIKEEVIDVEEYSESISSQRNVNKQACDTSNLNRHSSTPVSGRIQTDTLASDKPQSSRATQDTFRNYHNNQRNQTKDKQCNNPSVGRIHWIYRKRKMPIPSIPVSFRLEDTQLSRSSSTSSNTCSMNSQRTSLGYETDLSDLDNGDNLVSSPCKRVSLQTTLENPHQTTQPSWNVTSIDNSSNLQTSSTRHLHSFSDNSSMLTGAQYNYSPSNVFTQPVNYPVNTGQCSNSDNMCDSQFTYNTSVTTHNNTSSSSLQTCDTQSTIQSCNQPTDSYICNSSNWDQRPSQDNLQFTVGYLSSPNTNQSQSMNNTVNNNNISMSNNYTSNNNVALDKPATDYDNHGITSVPGYDSFMRHTSKHRLLYLLKRCTEKPTHAWHESIMKQNADKDDDDWHESMILSQKRSKEGDSLEEEDSVEEKVSTPLLEMFKPLNITLN